MSKIELIATATFGLEAVVKREIEHLGYKILKSEDAKITYLADERGIVRSNLHLRCADRVLVKMGEFDAAVSEDLFQQTKALAWEAVSYTHLSYTDGRGRSDSSDGASRSQLLRIHELRFRSGSGCI